MKKIDVRQIGMAVQRRVARSHRGFTLLMAVLVASVLLALGFAIYNIVSKEIVLSSAGRESQFAFYAADTGVECALYWDFVDDSFSIGSPATEIFCGEAGLPIALTKELVGDTITTSFEFSLGLLETDPCAIVTVERTESPNVTTRIESLGYNTCVETNPRRIERAIRAQY